MNGCWLMWLGDCCIRLCWWGLWSCWENCTGCSAARLPATLLITGTDCDCDVFKPAMTKTWCQTQSWRDELFSKWRGGGGSLWAIAMTPERGMMRFCACWWLWWELWMLVSVLTGGRPPPEPEIWLKIGEKTIWVQRAMCYTRASVCSCYVNPHNCIFQSEILLLIQ